MVTARTRIRAARGVLDRGDDQIVEAVSVEIAGRADPETRPFAGRAGKPEARNA